MSAIPEPDGLWHSHYTGEVARIVTYKTVYTQSLIDAFSANDAQEQVERRGLWIDAELQRPGRDRRCEPRCDLLGEPGCWRRLKFGPPYVHQPKKGR